MKDIEIKSFIETTLSRLSECKNEHGWNHDALCFIGDLVFIAEQYLKTLPTTDVKWWQGEINVYYSIGDKFYIYTPFTPMLEAEFMSSVNGEMISVGTLQPHTPTPEQQSALEKWMKDNGRIK